MAGYWIIGILILFFAIQLYRFANGDIDIHGNSKYHKNIQNQFMEEMLRNERDEIDRQNHERMRQFTHEQTQQMHDNFHNHQF